MPQRPNRITSTAIATLVAAEAASLLGLAVAAARAPRLADNGLDFESVPSRSDRHAITRSARHDRRQHATKRPDDEAVA